MRKAFIQVLREELSRDAALAVFLGDISVAGFLGPDDQLIDRVFNCGILEQAMVSFAAGCSAGGLYPVVQTIIPFLIERAFEQIKLDFCAQNNPGLLVGVGGGLEYSKLGYTHHAIWDTALLVNLEGLQLFTPTIGVSEVRATLQATVRARQLMYARLTECYLESGYEGPYEILGLSRLKSVRSDHATILCGAFPGIQRIFDHADCDVYAYSFPNLIPSNLDALKDYNSVEVWEFGTSPILTTILRRALPNSRVSGFYQKAGFFRSYGQEAAQRFIADHWISVV